MSAAPVQIDMRNQPLTSFTLLEGLRSPSDQHAWAEFYRRYAPMLAGVARRMGLSAGGAADAVQETVMAVHLRFTKQAEPFDRSCGSFKNWLMGVARHKVQDQKRRRRRAVKVGLIGRGDAGLADHTADPASTEFADEFTSEIEREFETQWRWCLLRRALDEIAGSVEPETFQAFQLYVLDQSPASHVATLLGVTKNTVYLAKHKILRRLRQRVEQLAAEEVGSEPIPGATQG